MEGFLLLPIPKAVMMGVVGSRPWEGSGMERKVGPVSPSGGGRGTTLHHRWKFPDATPKGEAKKEADYRERGFWEKSWKEGVVPSTWTSLDGEACTSRAPPGVLAAQGRSGTTGTGRLLL